MAAIVETGRVAIKAIKASTSSTATTTTTGTVVNITLESNTVATIFGVVIPFLSFSYYSATRVWAIQDAAVNKQIVLAQLFGKGVAVEQTATLDGDGPKGSPYHVVGDDNNYAVVWGPFKFTGKKIQVALLSLSSSILLNELLSDVYGFLTSFARK